MATCIRFSNVSKRYGGHIAVDNLSLEIASGEVIGLLGPNGAGKSTSLYMVSGLVYPTSGTISVFGKELHRHFVEIAGRMGVLVERPAFFDYLTVRRNLRIQARLAGREVSVDRILDMVGLLELGEEKAGALSQGFRQRLGLAQAMLTEPELLILDEPTSGLDVESTQEILRMLRRLADEAKVTILFSSHLLHEVELLCERVAIINKGKLVACERISTLLSYDQTQVEVLLEGTEGAAKRLQEQSWVESVEAKPGHLYIRLREANVHQLTYFLINAGYPIAGVIPRRRTLQDYFLKVLNS